MHRERPSFAKASEGILLRGQAGCNPAKRLGAKQDGGEGRTRTFEAMRRLIYSQLPLPLGTLPRPTASPNRPPEWRRTGPWMALRPKARLEPASTGAFMSEAGWQSQPMEPAKNASDEPKLPYSSPRDTSSP